MANLAAGAQLADPTSMLRLYRDAMRIRRVHSALGDGTLRWLDAPAGALVFAREPGFVCAANVSAAPFALPADSKVLLASAPLDAGALPPDTAVWLTLG